MDLGIIKSKLISIYNSETVKSGIKRLISQIDAEMEIEQDRTDIASVSSLIDDYDRTLNALEMDFLAIEGDEPKDISKRMYNLNEQLCVLSLINAYLASIRIPKNTNDYNMNKYNATLNERKENFKSLAVQKTACLKSLYVEQERNTKLLEYKILQKDFSSNE